MWEVKRSQKNNDTLIEELRELEHRLLEVELMAEAPYWMGVKADIDNARIEKSAIKRRIDRVKKKLSED